MRKKKKNNEEKLENFFDVLLRNYRNVPGFRAIVKLLIPLIFCFIIMIVVATGKSSLYDTVEDTTPKTEETTKLTYRQILDKVYTDSKNYLVDIKINEAEYHLEGKIEENTITGFIENVNGIKNFKINEENIYEIKMGKEQVNPELFNEINIDYIIPEKTIKMIESYTADTKSAEDGNTKYNYNLENQQINVVVSNEKVLKISIEGENYSYIIQYN